MEIKSLFTGLYTAFLSLFDRRSAEAELAVNEPEDAKPIEPLREIEIQIPGGELVTFKRGSDLFQLVPAEGNLHCTEPDDRMGWAHFEYRRFNMHRRPIGESPERWGAFLACILTRHSSKLADLKCKPRTFYNGGCTCGHLQIYDRREDGAYCRAFPLMELANRFSWYKQWDEVETANKAMQTLAEALAEAIAAGDPELALASLKSALATRSALNRKLYFIRKDAVDAYVRARRNVREAA